MKSDNPGGDAPAPAAEPKADWSKTHPRSAGCLALFGLPFILGGMLCVLAALRVFPPDPRDAPPWVIFTAGVVFLAPGLFFFTAGLWTMATARFPADRRSLAQGTLITVVLAGMAVISGYAALFGDPRSFSGFGPTGTVAEKRFWFGLAAVLIGALALLFGTLTIAAASARRRSRIDQTKGRT